MKCELLEQIAESIIQELLNNKSNNGENNYIWFEIYSPDKYTELNLGITRWYNENEKLLLITVTIENLAIWDEENNNLATEDNYKRIIKLLEQNQLIDSSYTYNNNKQ